MFTTILDRPKPSIEFEINFKSLNIKIYVRHPDETLI